MLESILISIFGNAAYGFLKKLIKKMRPAKKEDGISTGEGEVKKLLTPLPPRRVRLIGRDDDVKELGNRVDRAGCVVLVNGLGGIGKTEVCKHFFIHNYGQYTHAAWVDYVSSIKESFVTALGSGQYNPGLIELNPADTVDERFGRIMAALNRLDKNSLLVIDNIEDPEDEDLLRICQLPFKVIANSRLNLQGFETFSLDFLSAASCKKLFYRFYEGSGDDEHVEKIVGLCGSHTLTVELLARTARNAGMTVKGLYDILKEKGFNLHDTIKDKVNTFWHNEKERKQFLGHLEKVFDLSVLSEEEMVVLMNLSVLPAISIDMNRFCEWLGLESKEEITSLVAKGWLKREAKEKGDGFTIFLHQVLQEVIRSKAGPNAETCGQLITALANKLSLAAGDNPINKKDYVIFADVVVRHINENDKELARLSNEVSHIHWHQGQLEKALEFQEKAVKIDESNFDKNHPSLATSYNNLSMIYKAQGQLEKALEFQEKAVAILQKLFPNGHYNLDIMKNNLEILKEKMAKK